MGTGTGTDETGTGTGTGTDETKAERRTEGVLFDHEKLVVYRLAREFLVFTKTLPTTRVPRELRDQFDRSTVSILSNLAEGAGKMARADKQRFYEIARGSTLECASQLEIMLLRDMIKDPTYQQARNLLIRIAQMLSRLSGGPRKT